MRLAASVIVFERADGMVGFARVYDIKLKAGDKVTTGQAVAVVRNNGMARNPRLHIGAVNDHRPVQIRWDLRAEGSILGLVGD